MTFSRTIARTASIFKELVFVASKISTFATRGVSSTEDNVFALAKPWKRIFTLPSGSATFLIIEPTTPAS